MIWSYLKSSNGGRLEPEISFEILGDFSDETLEGQLPDEELSGLLVSPDLTESHSSGPVSVGLLDSSGGGGRLPGSLGGQLLPGSLSSGGLTGGLLGTSHGECSDDTDEAHTPAPAYISSPAWPGGATFLTSPVPRALRAGRSFYLTPHATQHAAGQKFEF